MACNRLKQPEMPFSTSNMLFCTLEIGHNFVLHNIGGATAPPASWGLNL